MKKIMINLVPGPTSVEDRVLKKMAMNYGSGDLDLEFLELYNKTEEKLQKILGTKNPIIIQTGEGMWGLWGALKSTLKPGDKIVAVCNGIFSYGIADMAESIGADVLRVELDYNQTLNSTVPLEAAVKKHNPLMITAVHCETPSGTLNPLNLIARVKKELNVPLLCVDTVASSGGCFVEVDQNLIDLSLNGSQKALSAPPSMSFVSVSPKAWERIEQVNYSGYDAFLPFKNAQKEFYFPNTPYWHGMAALEEAASILLDEGLENVYDRHKKCMEFCHKRLQEMNLEIFPDEKAVCAPTVTAVKLPENHTWERFNQSCLDKGLWITGSYGELSGHVFRIGHMGNQARIELLKSGLDIIETILKNE
ncbi:MAG: pyridoxal-phosphate-dependent aminotransferase family protein [Candidatus Rifleibacteriota bacterium]